MAESTLSLTYTDLVREVARFLSYGTDDSDYSTEEAAEIDMIVQSGYRQFLSPPPTNQGEMAHVWTFLSPEATLATVAGTSDYDLPDDFGSMQDNQVRLIGTGSYQPIPVVSEGIVRARRAEGDTTRRPEIVAVRPKSCDGTAGQRWEILFWPNIDAVYSVGYRYNVLVATKLSATYLYPLGGMNHGETILASCLEVAELRKDDVAGPYAAKYATRLAASISMDQQSLPKRLGYNSDNSQFHGTDRSITYPEYNGTIWGDHAP